MSGSPGFDPGFNPNALTSGFSIMGKICNTRGNINIRPERRFGTVVQTSQT